MPQNTQKNPLPVIVLPNNLKFYVSKRSTHTQTLTLYNLHDSAVLFKVECTDPDKYLAIEARGSVGPQMMVEILISHTAATQSNSNITDKLRILIQDPATRKVLGKKEVEVTLLLQEEKECVCDSLSHTGERSVVAHEQRIHNTNRANKDIQLIQIIAFIVGFFCLVSLTLPTQYEEPQPTELPRWMHLTVSMKIILAFISGCASVILLRS